MEISSGYEADEEQWGLLEAEEEEPVARRFSVEHITAKRGRGSHNSRRRRRKRDSNRMLRSESQSDSDSLSDASACSTQITSLPDRVKRLRFSASESEEDDRTMYLGRTSCRTHGQYPRRHRNYDVTCIGILRGGVVKGVAANLNDRQAIPQAEDAPAISVQWVSRSNNTEQMMSDATSWKSISPSPPPPAPLNLANLSSIHCNVSSRTCNIAEAVSFAPRARLLLEAHAPHHVVHHNGAYESFLLQQRKWMPPELLSSAQYWDLTKAVKELFVNQAVTLHPVQTLSPDDNGQEGGMVVTHYLLELESGTATIIEPSLTRSSSAGTDITSTTTNTTTNSKRSGFCSSLPAQAVG